MRGWGRNLALLTVKAEFPTQAAASKITPFVNG